MKKSLYIGSTIPNKANEFLMFLPEGFILGLSTGTVCLATCGPVIFPLLLGENRSVSENTIHVGIFLSGRLAAYLLTGLLAGLLGTQINSSFPGISIFTGILFILLAFLMGAFGFYRFGTICLGHTRKFSENREHSRFAFMGFLTGGFLSGINICPPFLLAIAGAIDTHRIIGGIYFFLLFFLGTSVYFLPMPLLGFFKRQRVLRIVGKFAAILAGLFYLFRGIGLVLSGV